MKSSADVVIVGSGFFGLTLAELITRNSTYNVLVVEKRNHIGGNSWSEIDPISGIEFHNYGTHIFHTNNLRVWEYVNNFSKFNDYKHKVLVNFENSLLHIPINLLTLSEHFGGFFTPESGRAKIESITEQYENLSEDSLESKAIKSVGAELYEKLIRGYTEKQWQTDPKLLPADIISRLPIRLNFNSNYFDDDFQGIPIQGYRGLLQNMCANSRIDVLLETDYFKVRNNLQKPKLTIYTGPIDRYFNYSEGVLGWRTVDLDFQSLDTTDFQGTSVVNYTSLDVPFTRIHEFKHLHPERKEVMNIEKTIIAREFSRMATMEDDPYYPINSERDRAILERYRKLTEFESNVIFGGRLGSYKYLDMHMAIAAAISKFENKVAPLLGINVLDSTKI